MTTVDTPTSLPLARSSNETTLRRVIGWVVTRPATVFFVLSILFGLIIMALNPPLRGPDEPAHLLRSYGYAGGEILPSAEVEGRKGIYVPAPWNDGVEFYHGKQLQFWNDKTGYRGHLAEYWRQQATHPANDTRPPVFRLYEGSEAYTAVAYLPYIAAGIIARLASLDFLSTIYLMRLFGLLAMSAVAAYAIAVTPRLKWAFFLIAMMPAALYGRTAVSADGATISFAMMATALCLRAATQAVPDGPWRRAGWMLLCVLAKPPQIAFVLLETMTRRWRELPRHWKSVALVVLPGVVLSPLWIVAVSGEMAAWRIVATTNLPAEQFDPVWKLKFMASHPLQFPYAMFNTIATEWNGLWHQLIGVLGWLDMRLQPAAYLAITIALVAVMVERLELDRATRWRIAAVSLVTFAAYTTAVFMILYMTWTPPTEETVWGIQGRYFIPALPALAAAVAALCNLSIGQGTRAGIAILGACGSAIACIEALWRHLW